MIKTKTGLKSQCDAVCWEDWCGSCALGLQSGDLIHALNYRSMHTSTYTVHSDDVIVVIGLTSLSEPRWNCIIEKILFGFEAVCIKVIIPEADILFYWGRRLSLRRCRPYIYHSIFHPMLPYEGLAWSGSNLEWIFPGDSSKFYQHVVALGFFQGH